MSKEYEHMRKIIEVHIVITVIFGILIILSKKEAAIHAAADTLPMMLGYYIIRLYTDNYRKVLPLGVGLAWGGVRWIQLLIGKPLFGAESGSFMGALSQFTTSYPMDIIACFVGLFMMYLFVDFERYERGEVYSKMSKMSDVVIVLAVIFCFPLGIPLFLLKCMDVKDKNGKRNTVGSTIGLVFLLGCAFALAFIMMQVQIGVNADRLRH